MAGLVNLAIPGLARQPQAFLHEPLPQGFSRNLYLMPLRELLADQGRAEIVVAFFHQLKDPLPELRAISPMTSATAFFGSQRGRATRLVGLVQTSEVPIREPQQASGFRLGQSTITDSLENSNTIQLLVTHGDNLPHLTSSSAISKLPKW